MTRKEKYDTIPAKESSDILKRAIKERELTQVEVADRIGIRQSGLSGLINRPKMTMYGFGTVLNAMDYDIVVVDRNTGEVIWKVAVK